MNENAAKNSPGWRIIMILSPDTKKHTEWGIVGVRQEEQIRREINVSEIATINKESKLQWCNPNLMLAKYKEKKWKTKNKWVVLGAAPPGGNCGGKTPPQPGLPIVVIPTLLNVS